MSRFTKRRKIARVEKEKRDRHLKENSEKFEKGMEAILDSCKDIETNHPEFEELTDDERVAIFNKYVTENRLKQGLEAV